MAGRLAAAGPGHLTQGKRLILLAATGRAPLLVVTEQWECPNCDVTDATRGLPANAGRFHTCPGLHNLTAPLVRAGTRCKVEAEERQEYLGSEVQARGGDGRQYMAVRTTADDRDDLLVFAGLAHAELR